MHEIVNLLQLGKTDRLEGSLDDATTEELQSLGRVLSVADVGTADRDHLDDGFEDGSAEVGACWETDADDCSSGTDVLFEQTKSVKRKRQR